MQTIATHAGEDTVGHNGSVTQPIYQTTTFTYNEAAPGEFRYTRNNNNPNQLAVAEKLKALEQAADALVLNSGMSAISSTMLALLKAGDHALVQDTLYGITHALFHDDFKQLGITVSSIDATDAMTWNLTENTKVIYVEALSNPLLQVPDLSNIVRFAKRHNLVSVIDSTFAPPPVFQPLPFGFDVVVHSATKYLNGHSDVTAGVVASSDDKLIARIRTKANRLGGAIDPHACFLLQRGLKTLGLRMKQHNATAFMLAEFLKTYQLCRKVASGAFSVRVSKVNYSYKPHEAFTGGGGVLSFEVDPPHNATHVVQRLRLATTAVSLGGVETLVTRPATTTHAVVSRAEREKLGITDGLIRVAVGLEDAEDIIQDFKQALDIPADFYSDSDSDLSRPNATILL